MNQPTLYTVNEAAAVLRVSRVTIYQMLKRGELRSLTIGRARRITAESIADLVSAAS